ncbi:MAG: glycosyltransferase family 2 protein [Chloroflexi bacterium]|nr:glycosyltransferase family 2 protein [Chloroflexota bacterium]
MKSASVIIINWNGASHIDTCLRALQSEATNSDEIIVVDNASTDHSVEFVRTYFSAIRLVCNEANLGYAGGANVGLRAARGDVLVLLNPDVEVRSGWLDAVKAGLEPGDVGVVGCKLLYPGGNVIQHAGGILKRPLGLSDHYGYGRIDVGQFDTVRDVDFVTGAAFALRRDLLESVGFFDDAFYPAYSEEVDYCLRVREAGYRVLYVPTAVAIHHEYSSVGGNSSQYYQFFHRNRLRLMFKHCTMDYLLKRFVPEEMVWLSRQARVEEGAIMPRLYLEAAWDYPATHRRDCGDSGKDAWTIAPMITALHNLHDYARRQFAQRKGLW